MINLKSDKGVTLLVLTITIIVLLIITSITISNSKSQLAIKNVNYLYSDIDSISTKVSDYYLKNNSLPVLANAYLNNRNALKLLCISNEEDESLINPNDDGEYYVIDLSKLENLTLNYGKDYKNWDTSSTFQTYQDLYIINKVSHQIYYPKGVKYNGEVYFTKSSGSGSVNKVESNSSVGDIVIESISPSKTTIIDSDKVILSADVKLNITFNYQKDTLEYSWSASDVTENINYTGFYLDDTNSAILMSNQLENVANYYLYIKVTDINGNEHTIKQEVISN